MNSLNKRENASTGNSTIEVQIDHRTIRAFTDEPLAEDGLMTLYEVARHTASSSLLQQTTIIRVADPIIRGHLHVASGRSYVGGTCGELLVLIVDQYRDSHIREEGGVDNAPPHRTNLLLTALHGALLAVQNVVVTAGSVGLGACCLGSIHADPHAVIETLGLPELTFPVPGLLVGHPDQEPRFEPRLPLSVIAAENSYPKVDSYSELITNHDEIITNYYDTHDTSKRIEFFSTLAHTTIGVTGVHVPPVLEVLDE